MCENLLQIVAIMILSRQCCKRIPVIISKEYSSAVQTSIMQAHRSHMKPFSHPANWYLLLAVFWKVSVFLFSLPCLYWFQLAKTRGQEPQFARRLTFAAREAYFASVCRFSPFQMPLNRHLGVSTFFSVFYSFNVSFTFHSHTPHHAPPRHPPPPLFPGNMTGKIRWWD